jgi:hypothetical protein
MPTEISGSTGVNKIQDGTVVTADVNTSNPDLGILTTATNSNGRYIKFADGTLIQFITETKSSLSFADIGGGWFRTNPIYTNTFPIAFHSTSNIYPVFTASRHYTASLDDNTIGNSLTTTTFDWILRSGSSGSNYTTMVHMVFFGRWKA